MQKYGQHFLVNKGIINKILDAAADNMQPRAAEIGPGKGALTEELLKITPRLTCVEIDAEMVSFLREKFPALEIINSDFLKFDLNELPREKTLFVSNLPYIDAAEILEKVLCWEFFGAGVFMFQKEQALRITAAPATEFYGPLGVISQTLAEIEHIVDVSPGSFNPPPKVRSSVLLFKPRAKDFDTGKFKKTVRAAFAYKRKNILNSLLLSAALPKERLENALLFSGIDPLSRASDLPKEMFLALARNI